VTRIVGKDGKETAVVRLVNDLRFRGLIASIILGSAICASYEGPFVKAEFGREYEAFALEMCTNVFGATFLIENVLKLWAMGWRGYFMGESAFINSFDTFCNSIFVVQRAANAAGVETGGIVNTLKVFRMVRSSLKPTLFSQARSFESEPPSPSRPPPPPTHTLTGPRPSLAILRRPDPLLPAGE
jgi:hypothetical protein